MQNWIAGLLAVLGTLLVLAGATTTVLQGTTPATAPQDTGAKRSLLARLRQLDGPQKLLMWGVVLLVIAAIAAGAISFNIGAQAGTR